MSRESLTWVKTSFFPIEPGEDEETNPEIYGRAFAKWLVQELKARGEHVGDPIPEDWGWCILLCRMPYLLWIGCANRQGETDEWGAFVSVEPGFVPRLFRSVAARKKRLEALLLEVMQSVPQSERVWVGE